MLQLGDRVKVADTSRCAADWRGWTGFVVGLRMMIDNEAVDVTVSDHFPPRHLGDLTSGFAFVDLEKIT